MSNSSLISIEPERLRSAWPFRSDVSGAGMELPGRGAAFVDACVCGYWCESQVCTLKWGVGVWEYGFGCWDDVTRGCSSTDIMNQLDYLFLRNCKSYSSIPDARNLNTSTSISDHQPAHSLMSSPRTFQSAHFDVRGEDSVLMFGC